MGRYDELKAEWERRREDPDRGAGDWLVDKPELALDAAAFLATLRRLAYQTQDPSLFDLHRKLITSNLIDRKTGKWSRYGTTLAHPDSQLLCRLIEENIAAGISETEVIAEAVTEFNIDAASFQAAQKQIKRLLDEWRVRQKTA